MAEAVGSSSLLINGVVAPKSIFGLTGYFDVAPNAVRLDEGDILVEVGLPGVEAGRWSVSSNSSSQLILRLNHPQDYSVTFGGEVIGTFNATIGTIDYRIPYRVSNGTTWVYHNDEFTSLVKTNGTYSSDINEGPLYIQRVDSQSYPPYSAYQTTLQLILEAQ
jgi:hypothetical protein